MGPVAIRGTYHSDIAIVIHFSEQVDFSANLKVQLYVEKSVFLLTL